MQLRDQCNHVVGDHSSLHLRVSRGMHHIGTLLPRVVGIRDRHRGLAPMPLSELSYVERVRFLRGAALAMPNDLPPTSSPSPEAPRGLKYVTGLEPGIRRIKSGKGFRYLGPEGEVLRDK